MTPLQLILVILQVVSPLAFASPSNLGCSEPGDLDVRFHDNMHESFLLLTASDHRRSSDTRFYENIYRAHVQGNRTCNFPENSNAATSTCPWHYILNVDQNRRPVEIIEAKCNCPGQCLSGPPNSKCHPVKYFIRVLRKYSCDFETRTFLYRQTVEPITVGCTCGIA